MAVTVDRRRIHQTIKHAGGLQMAQQYFVSKYVCVKIKMYIAQDPVLMTV